MLPDLSVDQIKTITCCRVTLHLTIFLPLMSLYSPVAIFPSMLTFLMKKNSPRCRVLLKLRLKSAATVELSQFVKKKLPDCKSYPSIAVVVCEMTTGRRYRFVNAAESSEISSKYETAVRLASGHCAKKKPRGKSVVYVDSCLYIAYQQPICDSVGRIQTCFQLVPMIKIPTRHALE